MSRPSLVFDETRIEALRSWHRETFGSTAAPAIASAPGRTELGGNHTDHNNGRVLAAAVQLDSLAVVEPVNEPVIRLQSRGFGDTISVALSTLEPVPEETGTTAALIRGVASGIQKAGGTTDGFRASVESRVLPGSGLSSSASFEMLIATIINDQSNGSRFSTVELAKICQTAENDFFGKPCGLMDQLACGIGGVVAIDFEQPGNPTIESLDVSFGEYGYDLLVVDTGGNHADLTPEYAAVPDEMRKVAAFFGKQVLRSVSLSQLRDNLKELREAASDRAILRAFHYLQENERVSRMVAALHDGAISDYLSLVTESGRSSWELLQNCFTTRQPAEQGITLALTATEDFLRNEGLSGACRVHGGGFAGTIQAYIPSDKTDAYRRRMEPVFGSVTPLAVRADGAALLTDPEIT